jgi:hypothetical protein
MKTIRYKTGLFTLGIVTALVGLAACGTTHSRDESAVDKIQTAAVVAFSVIEPAPPKLALSLTSGKVGAEAGGSMISKKNENHVDQMYTELLTSMNSKLHWKVMSPGEMGANAGYQKAFDSTMKGFQNKMPPGAGQQQYLVDNVMDFDSPRILDSKGRDELIRALGVDAIVVARVDVMLDGFSIMGFGTRHPQSRLCLMVYTLGHERPVWFDGGIDGKESDQSVGATAFIDQTLLGELALESVKTAYAKLSPGPGSSSTE